MISCSIHNFGCRVNQAEAFSWAEELRRRGISLEETFKRSDIVLVNSCTLTGRADRDVRRFIHKVVRENPGAKLVVTGCCAEREGEEIRKMPGVWLVVPNGEKGSLIETISSLAGIAEEAPIEARPYKARAFVKIQDGCDFRCTYCVIPGVRGRSASVSPDAVLDRLRTLGASGYREAVLAGIHLCSYGLDFRPAGSLLDLLRRIEKADGPRRIRLSSLDPRFLDGPLREHMTSSARIAPHYHLSLQSGSSSVLESMGRGASSPEGYERIVDGLRKASPDASIGADILVGFPAETDGEFLKTRDFLSSVSANYFHVFPYSPREGTAAARMKQVAVRKRMERAADLRALSAEKDLLFRKGFLGRELDGVVISRNGEGAEVLTGNFIPVSVPVCPAPRGEWAEVRITGVSASGTTGEIASGKKGS